MIKLFLQLLFFVLQVNGIGQLADIIQLTVIYFFIDRLFKLLYLLIEGGVDVKKVYSYSLVS